MLGEPDERLWTERHETARCTAPIRVLCVDHHPIFRDGIASAIGAHEMCSCDAVTKMIRSDCPDLRTRELLTIVALTECGSFVAAAARMKMTQPSLTRTVKRLERILGVKLFARSTRHVEITPAGREFVAVAERMLNDLKILSRNLDECDGTQRGRVTMSTYAVFAGQSMPPIAQCFLSTRPFVEAHIRERSQNEMWDDIRSGVADFGVGLIAAADKAFQTKCLFQEPVYVVLPRGHRLCKLGRSSVRLAELKGEPLVSLGDDPIFHRVAEAAATSLGFSIRHAVIVACFSTILNHVKAGVGPAIVPSGVLPPAPWEDIEAYPLIRPTIERSVGIITLKGRYLSPAATALAALVEERCVAPPAPHGVESTQVPS